MDFGQEQNANNPKTSVLKELALRCLISSSSNHEQRTNILTNKTKCLKWHPTTCVLRQWGFSKWAEHLYFLLALKYRLYICTFYPPPHAKRRTVSGHCNSDRAKND